MLFLEIRPTYPAHIKKRTMQTHRPFKDLSDQELANRPLRIHHHKNNQRDKEYGRQDNSNAVEVLFHDA